MRSKITWGKTFKNGRSKFCGRQLLGPFLNTLPSILGSEKKSLTDIGRKRLTEKFGKLLEEKKYFTRNFSRKFSKYAKRLFFKTRLDKLLWTFLVLIFQDYFYLIKIIPYFYKTWRYRDLTFTETRNQTRSFSQTRNQRDPRYCFVGHYFSKNNLYSCRVTLNPFMTEAVII